MITALLLSAASATMAQTQQVTVVELHPAPGQFVNTLPEASEGATHEEVCATATQSGNVSADNFLFAIISHL